MLWQANTKSLTLKQTNVNNIRFAKILNDKFKLYAYKQNLSTSFKFIFE